MGRGKRHSKAAQAVIGGPISNALDRSRPESGLALDPHLSQLHQDYITAYRALQDRLQPLVENGGCSIIVAVDRVGTTPGRWPNPTDVQIELLEEITDMLEVHLGAEVTIFAYGDEDEEDTFQPIKERGGKFNKELLKWISGDGVFVADKAIHHGRDLAANSSARHSILLIIPSLSSPDAVRTRAEYMRALRDGISVAAIAPVPEGKTGAARWLQEEFDNSWVECPESEEYLPTIAAAIDKALAEPDILL